MRSKIKSMANRTASLWSSTLVDIIDVRISQVFPTFISGFCHHEYYFFVAVEPSKQNRCKLSSIVARRSWFLQFKRQSTMINLTAGRFEITNSLWRWTSSINQVDDTYKWKLKIWRVNLKMWLCNRITAIFYHDDWTN